ncbi:uncharacterized protein L203_105904 [Cryptococcus depauperatus CBS 7841]|uniref:Uncharacterized protein n=1 Tax=Cryptococcus depauperatus CBS 7841 TaxID=1295531 RepID=A0AAJ8M4E9_9TREE
MSSLERSKDGSYLSRRGPGNSIDTQANTAFKSAREQLGYLRRRFDTAASKIGENNHTNQMSRLLGTLESSVDDSATKVNFEEVRELTSEFGSTISYIVDNPELSGIKNGETLLKPVKQSLDSVRSLLWTAESLSAGSRGVQGRR